MSSNIPEWIVNIFLFYENYHNYILFIFGYFVATVLTFTIPKINKVVVQSYSNEHQVGVLVILFGVICAFISSSIPLVNNFFSAIGGALVGAGISAVISKIAIISLEEKIYQVVSESHKIGMSHEDKVNDFRQKWYVYHVTKFEKDGDNYKWRYSIWDFGTNDRAYGKLLAYVDSPSVLGNEPHKYRVEGFIKSPHGERLVACTTRTDNTHDPAGIYVFPFFMDKDKSTHTGFCVIKSSWADAHILSPCIISNNNILQKTKDTGLVEDAEDIKLLYDTFNNGNSHILLPNIKIKS